jgi:hypothetical protein
MNRSIFSGLFVSFIVSSLVGCAAEQGNTPDGPDGDEGSSENALRAGVAPGKFLLHAEANHVANPECDTFTDLTLKASGRAELSEHLTGRCALVAFHDPQNRAYTLRQTGTSCGSKIYEGSRRVPAGPAATAVAQIKIVDHRSRLCKDIVASEIVVEETVPGGITTTRHSQMVVETGGKVSGFDFEGPKALPKMADRCAFFRQPDEEIACSAVGGVSTQAEGCVTLCSKPIAERGKSAGYGFDGYKQLDKSDVLCTFHRQPDEDKACGLAGGTVTQAAGCAILCSTPIAKSGAVAGYDLEGFKVLANDRVPVEFCTEQVSIVQVSCSAVGGSLRAANGCAQLCSLPL